MEKLGIYWSGQVGENQGRLYLDEAAVTNELLVPVREGPGRVGRGRRGLLLSKPDLRRHYDKTSEVGPAVLGETGWYDIAVQKISVGGQDFTSLGCAPEPGKPCVMATGQHLEAAWP